MSWSIPHIATTGGWNTGVVAYNPSEETCLLTITAYDDDGAQVNRFVKTLASGAKFVGQPASLGFSELAHWIKVQGSEPLAGFELFSSNDQNLLAGYTGVNIQRASGILPKIEKDGSTGVALVNSSGTQTTVTLTAYDDAGSAVARPLSPRPPTKKKWTRRKTSSKASIFPMRPTWPSIPGSRSPPFNSTCLPTE